MKRRELLALIFASISLGMFLLFIQGAIERFLPGAQDAMKWILEKTGQPMPDYYWNPWFGVLAIAIGFLAPACLCGLIAVLAWRSAAQERRHEKDRFSQTFDWGASACIHFSGELFKASTENAESVALKTASARRTTLPHLMDLHRYFFESLVARLEGRPMSRGRLRVRAARAWVPLAFNVLVVLACGQVGMGLLSGFSLSLFSEMPAIGMPIGTSAIFLGVSIWLIGALVALFAAFGLRWMSRQIGSWEASVEAGREVAAVRFTEGVLGHLGTFAGIKADKVGILTQQIAGATAVALLEAVDVTARRPILETLVGHGLLRAPAPLDLRGANLGAVDLQGVEWPGIVLTGAQLEGSSFSDARLEGADFSEAALAGANFQGSICRGARFKGSDLRGARLQRVDLQDADLSQCELSGALLWGVSLEGAQLEGTRLPPSSLPDGPKSDGSA